MTVAQPCRAAVVKVYDTKAKKQQNVGMECSALVDMPSVLIVIVRLPTVGPL